MLRVFIILMLIFLASCQSEAFNYAKARHPGCVVTLLDETSEKVHVRIACSSEEPFEQTFRKR